MWCAWPGGAVTEKIIYVLCENEKMKNIVPGTRVHTHTHMYTCTRV